MKIVDMPLSAQVLVDALPQCAGAFPVNDADRLQSGQISIIQVFVKLGDSLVDRFAEQVDLR